MTDKQFIDLSHQKKCPHCRGSNIAIYSHPDNYNCKVIYCEDCYGYPSICSENGQTYISDNIKIGENYCKICGDSEMLLNTHALAYPYI